MSNMFTRVFGEEGLLGRDVASGRVQLLTHGEDVSGLLLLFPSL